MKQYFFNIHISYQEFERVYRGTARSIIATDSNGMRIQIPALRFLPFLDRSGINGRFVLSTDSNNKFLSLQKV
ncbi:hypothetical protein OAG1_18850 [Agarivorans sp. OAG1]|uniref:DUF2835 domain-containing protein n=2 Tax=Agarivorans TaxID=261825 RepID=R9PTB0_AGAAL|nr:MULTISPECIES: DUF2835 domain-containing protein [Agarivorans]BEU03085.1 hypothetical protein OAG1_18850 [Agarivorans sp. OAG1]MEE1673109.1 DUF2835 domain-containing protein [Agarivorans aestuarii]MPW28451.1 DUF2835 family protein [Agarivorans sp. B2Z047]UQN41015.1 DUF2835 domain-containing protein [Agarivorans sp. B2Z047]GAD02106.1 hypothetical protein AALB_2186 [Agarivorans albus MKT 106]